MGLNAAASVTGLLVAACWHLSLTLERQHMLLIAGFAWHNLVAGVHVELQMVTAAARLPVEVRPISWQAAPWQVLSAGTGVCSASGAIVSTLHGPDMAIGSASSVRR